MADNAIQGRSVFVVEDEVLIGMVLEDVLDLLGCTVAANATTMADAHICADQGGYDIAILDVHVAGEPVYPLADRLIAGGTPVIFATGASADTLPERFATCTVLEKPYAIPGVEAALMRALSPQTAA